MARSDTNARQTRDRDPLHGRCRRCGRPLRELRRSYCSQECRDKAARRRVRIDQRLTTIEREAAAIRRELLEDEEGVADSTCG